MMVEATPEFNYHVEKFPEPEQVGTIKVYLNFLIPEDMEPFLTRSNFSCSIPANEFIDDEASPDKQRLYYFLADSGVENQEAYMLILKLVRLARDKTSSSSYCSHYGLLLYLTLHVAPSREEGSFLDDSLVEEAIRASLDEYERDSEIIPAKKLRVDALSKRIYKRKRKTSSIANQCKSNKRKHTCYSADECPICLDEFKSGQEVATLLCGHQFDNKCVMDWLEVGEVCPMCRFKLPREGDDYEIPQITEVF